MDNAEDQFKRELEARLSAYGGRPFVAEKALGLPQDAIRSIFRGTRKAGTSLNRAKELCDAFGLEFYIGPPRDLSSIASAPAADAFANIPLYDAQLAAGGGHANGAEIVSGHLAFRRDWLTKIGVAPQNAVLARAVGDSMKPSIFPNDMVMIDTSRKDVPLRKTGAARRRSAIYALVDNGDARLKRIERPSLDQVLLLSDNPDYPPELADARDISVIGKVVWWGHTSEE